MSATGYTDPAAVVGVAHTVAQNDTLYINRVAQIPEAEGADVWQARYDGQRGLYVNGFACGRARSPVANQYAFRAMSHASAGANQAIGSFSLSDLTDKLVTRVNGDTEIARDLIAGRNVLGANLQNGAFTEPTYGTNVASDTSAGQATVGARLETLSDVVRLRGRLGISGSISSGVTLATLPVGLRPSSAQVINTRTGGTGAAAAFVTITTGGDISVNTALSSGSWVTLDNLTFPR